MRMRKRVNWNVRIRFSPKSRRFRRHPRQDRKSTRLNSSHLVISYAVFCLKKKIHRFERFGLLTYFECDLLEFDSRTLCRLRRPIVESGELTRTFGACFAVLITILCELTGY